MKDESIRELSKDELYRKEIGFRRAEHWERSCEDCNGLEDGNHYCLTHGMQIKNADIMRCNDFEGRE